jgi:AAA domain
MSAMFDKTDQGTHDLDPDEQAERAAAIADQDRRAQRNGQGSADDQEEADAKLLAGIRDGAWLDAQTFAPLRYAVPDLIPEGFTLLAGPPKIGKSWLMAGVLLGRAAGGYVLGKLAVGEPRRVLYLAMEDSDRRMQDRCRKLVGPGEPLPPLFHYLTKVEPGKVLATVSAFLRRYPETSLVVVDTLGKVMPTANPGESSYQRDYRIGGWLQEIALDHPGLAVVVNHHDRKAFSDDFIDSVSGTHGLAGAADSVFVLTRHRNETDGLLKVTGRDIPEAEYALVFEDGRHWRLDGDSLKEAAERARDVRATAGLGDRSAEIIAYVTANPPHVRASEVEEKFGPDARRYLTRLVDSGRLHRPSRGLYSAVPSVPSSHSQDQDAGDVTHGTHVTPTLEGDR